MSRARKAGAVARPPITNRKENEAEVRRITRREHLREIYRRHVPVNGEEAFTDLEFLLYRGMSEMNGMKNILTMAKRMA